MKTITLQRNVNVSETLSNGLIVATSHKYKEMPEVLADLNGIEVYYVYGQESHRVKQLTGWGFELKETIYYNDHALHAGIRQIWKRIETKEETTMETKTVEVTPAKEIPAENFITYFAEGDEIQVTHKPDSKVYEGIVFRVFPDSNEVLVSIDNGDGTFTKLFFNSPENSFFIIKTYEYKAVEEVQEAAPLEIKKAHFESKPSSIEEVKRKEISSYDSYAVVEEIEMKMEQFVFLSNDLLAGYDFLKGKGGTNTTTEPEGVEHLNHFYEMTEAQQQEWKRGAYRECVKVTSPMASYSLLIDPQGYDYGRYVAIEYK
ncbi:hypothetical protein [Bacillus paramobilis]|uniref:hypothetical protein n=1 Tax=Bacillus paramobilis TaxID=2817477 RepID=UPI001BB3F27B|nr:hypothetical protein [Bacillus paramobilis]HEF5065756.1 hypothetical protein [Bacillus cereus]HEF5237740.1 hypothetical protein [Bacillus cereus]